jgi:cell division protein FtsW
VALVIIEDFGTAALISLLGLLMLIIAGVKWWHVLTPLPFAAIVFCLALLSSPSRMRRIAAFLNPEKWTGSAAYQANQSLIALGSGGLWGKGLGRGICKYGHLPEDTTDFIFAIIGEELGFIGTAAVILLFGTEINYARRWFRIPLGPITISFQPSELAKWMIVFFLAAVCDKIGAEIKLYRKRFVPICSVIAVVVALVIIEDFGTAALISLLGLLMLIIAGVKWWHVLTPLPFAAIVFCLALLSSDSRMRRIAAFLNPEKWTGSAAYQANQSLIALGSGGLWGKGLGRGICKYGHLPEDTTDFIFAIIGEELGFIGTAAVILLFIVFVWLGILVVVRCQDRFGQLLAGGIVITIAAQAAVNIGVVTVVLPTKGMPLPFVSAGGTSMLLSAAAAGMLLNIAKQSAKNKAGEKE